MANRKMTKKEMMEAYLKAAKKYAEKEGKEAAEKVVDKAFDKVEEIGVKSAVAITKTAEKKGAGLLKAVAIKVVTNTVEGIVDDYCGGGLLSKAASGIDTLADLNLIKRGVGAAWTLGREYKKADVEEVRKQILDYANSEEDDDLD